MINRNSFYGTALPITDEDYLRGAKFLDVEPAVIQTVTVVETNGSPFLPDNRPDILFEAHLFGRHTGNKFAGVLDTRGKAISSTRWDRSLYGSAHAWQYTRLYRAMECDVYAAVKSASFGAFQILGQEYKTAGFSTLEDFVSEMGRSAGAHLDAFCRFVKTNKLDDELRSKDWANFARGYNGPAYAKNAYDTKMAQSYRKLAARWATMRASTQSSPLATRSTDPARDKVMRVQAALNAVAEINVNLKVDGWWGVNTSNAIKAFEQLAGLPVDGLIDDRLIAALGIQQYAQ